MGGDDGAVQNGRRLRDTLENAMCGIIAIGHCKGFVEYGEDGEKYQTMEFEVHEPYSDGPPPEHGNAK